MFAAVVLAAGCSRRFGDIKQLATVGQSTLIEHSVGQFYNDAQLLPQLSQLKVVLGANHSRISPYVRAPATVFVSSRWQQGMGASLAEFVQQLAPQTEHLLVALADQIVITSDDLSALLNYSAAYPEHIICAHYNNIQGAPVIFPRRFFSKLAQLGGDKGAKSLLTQYSEQVLSFDMPNAAFDVDTPHDLVVATHHLAGLTKNS